MLTDNIQSCTTVTVNVLGYEEDGNTLVFKLSLLPRQRSIEAGEELSVGGGKLP